MARRLVELLKRVPLVDDAVGLLRRRQHLAALRRAEREDPATPTRPPPHLRHRVHMAFDSASYEQVGEHVAADLSRVLADAGVPADGARVLDLGCGPGRVARWFKAAHPGCRLVGTDIDDEAIAWARAYLGEVGDFAVNAPMPPTAFAAGGFDLAYSVSLFTHLDEAMQFAWLDEVARLLRPGGHLLASVHGAAARGSCTPAERAALDRDGFVFRVSRRRFKADGLPGFYQTTFHDRRYVARAWARGFAVAAHVEGGLGGHHDLVLLRREDPADGR